MEMEELMMDVEGATRHLTRLMRARGGEAVRLKAMVQRGWRLEELAAQGVLAALAEAEEVIKEMAEEMAEEMNDDDQMMKGDAGEEDGEQDEQMDNGEDGGGGGDRGLGLRVFDELVRRWDAPVPMSLLLMLQGAKPDARMAGLREEVSTLRDRCARALVAQGVRWPRY